MAAGMRVATDFTAMQVQAVYIDFLIQEAADFELAFQMQLEEALRVSQVFGDENVSSSSATQFEIASDVDVRGKRPADESQSPNEGHQSPATEENLLGDRRASVNEQQDELRKMQQEMEDALVAIKEEERLRQLDAVIQHDAVFARFLVECSPNDSTERLDQLSDPFTFPPAADENTVMRSQGHLCGIRGGLNLEGASTSSAVHCKGDVWQPALCAAYFLEPVGKRYRSKITINDASDGDDGMENASLDDSEQCSICMDTAMSPSNSTVVSDSCNHNFCKACLQKHAETTVSNGRSYITCPEIDCEVLWNANLISEMLSISSQMILEQRQIEEAVPSSERVFCPYPECSVLQLKPEVQNQASSSDNSEATAAGGVECWFCNRFFCMKCLVPWHSGVSCADYQALPEDERTAEALSFKQLASSKKWQRCKQCGFTVERKEGCYHITCRCKYQFCYSCGGAWTHSHLCSGAR